MKGSASRQQDAPPIAMIAGATAALIVGQLATNLVPFLLTVSIRQAKLDETSASLLISVEFMSFLLSALIVGAVKQLRLNMVATLACLTYAGASLGSGQADDMWQLMAMRSICGFAGGAAMASGTRAIASHQRYEMIIATALIGGTICGAICLFTIPVLLERSGTQAVYIALAILALLSALFCWGLSLGTRQAPEYSGDKFPLTGVGLALIAAYVCVRLSDATYWPFAERLGARAGLEEETVGLVLALVTLLALTAPFVGLRIHRPRNQLIVFACALAAKALSAALLLVWPTPVGYALGQTIAIYTLVLALQLAMSRFAAVDATGRLAVLGGIAAMIADATGPIFSGLAFRLDGYPGIAIVSAGLSLVGMGILAMLVRSAKPVPAL